MKSKGSVEILCDEIEFPFKAGMETPLIIVAFTRQLVLEVADMHYQAETINGILRQQQLGPSVGSGELLDKTLDMLNCGNVESMVEQCADLHHLAHELNPEDAYPTDHLIDMLSSCVSAIRFGCDTKDSLSSRHAASAAQHVWKQRYGVTLFDRLTPHWEKDWARHIFTDALVAMALPATKGADERKLTDDEARDALASAIPEAGEEAARAENEWRPVESAPRDGTRILISIWMLNDPKNGRYCLIGRWSNEIGDWCDDEGDRVWPPVDWRPLPVPPSPPKDPAHD